MLSQFCMFLHFYRNFPCKPNWCVYWSLTIPLTWHRRLLYEPYRCLQVQSTLSLTRHVIVFTFPVVSIPYSEKNYHLFSLLNVVIVFIVPVFISGIFILCLPTCTLYLFKARILFSKLQLYYTGFSTAI